jgi:hypothetical protein
MNVFVWRGACPGVGVRGRCTEPTTRNTAIHRGIRHQFHDDKPPPGQRHRTPQNHHGTTPPNLRRQTTTEPMTPTLHHGTPPPNSRRHHQPNPRNEEHRTTPLHSAKHARRSRNQPRHSTAKATTRTITKGAAMGTPQSTKAHRRRTHDDTPPPPPNRRSVWRAVARL